MVWALLALLAGGCGDNIDDALYFTYDDRPLLCAFAIDDFVVPVDWDRVQERIDTALAQSWVLLAYAHTPGVTVSLDTLERAFSMFDAAGLAYTTYADLDPQAPPAPGIAFAFDDDSVSTWWQIRPMFALHGARVTFFVTEYQDFTDQGRAQLHDLADDGHAIEAHGVHHLDADTYPAGPDAYYTDEVAPSLAALRAEGYSPDAFAYPGGLRTAATDAAIEPHVRYLRATPGHCDR